MIKKRLPLLLCLLLLAGCGGQTNQSEDALPQSSSVQESQGDLNMNTGSYKQITAEQARAMMDEQEEYILLDVRTQAEFDEGHIEGAIVIPDTEISNLAEDKLTDTDATILVYCRSGRRSKLAAQTLADLGYANIYEFGGIIDWPYETVK